MKSVIKAAVTLAVLAAVLSVIVALVGLHRTEPMLAQAAFILPVIILNTGCIVWGLKGTAATNGYVRQVGNGIMIGAIAGVLIFGFSLLMLTVLMPGYLDEMKQATIEWLQTADIAEEMRDKQIATVEGTTATTQSMAGLVGTLATSLVVAVIAAIFLRRK